jgi:hypothetical protein
MPNPVCKESVVEGYSFYAKNCYNQIRKLLDVIFESLSQLSLVKPN